MPQVRYRLHHFTVTRVRSEMKAALFPRFILGFGFVLTERTLQGLRAAGLARH